jgi:hypothetical protein
MHITEIRFEGMNWIHLAQDRIQWQALVNTEINLIVPYKQGIFLTNCET